MRALLPGILLLLAACRGGQQDVQVQPGSVTPPAVSNPLDTPPSGPLALPVPPALPLPASQPDVIDVADRLAATVTWLLPDDDPGELAESLAQRIVSAPGVELRLAELGAGGGIIVFGATIDGHYLVTAGANGGARVELHLDPPTGASRQLGTAVALPAGYPVDAVPIYPGAVVVEASETPLADGLTRFELVLETRRAPGRGNRLLRRPPGGVRLDGGREQRQRGGDPRPGPRVGGRGRGATDGAAYRDRVAGGRISTDATMARNATTPSHLRGSRCAAA